MFDFKKLLRSFTYAFQGIKTGLSLDQNLRLHTFIAGIVLIVTYFLKVSKEEFLIVLLAIVFVLFTELINTAIEEMTNLIIKEHSQEAKIAKDVAAAGVLLSAVFAIVVAVLVLFPRVLRIFGV